MSNSRLSLDLHAKAERHEAREVPRTERVTC